MSTSLEAAFSTGQFTAELIRTVYGGESDGRMRSAPELRLAVLEWVLNLDTDPIFAAQSVLDQRATSHAAALPRIVIDLLEEIAKGRVAGMHRGRNRRAALKAVN